MIEIRQLFELEDFGPSEAVERFRKRGVQIMFSVLQVLTVILVAVAMALALAHALELPGKMRLDKETYYAMQPIYYPGFTIGGGIGEAGGTI
ncbi:hypothetical protein BH20PSE1_BH20PSE1_12420 [soil metagenome]